MRSHRLLLLGLAVLPGCKDIAISDCQNGGTRTTMPLEAIRILAAIPDGAVVLGTIEVTGPTASSIGRPAMAEALHTAAMMGANAIVVAEEDIGDARVRVRVTALRTSP